MAPLRRARSLCSAHSSGGREDVYPRRFESLRTGKSGYAPACANEWRPGVCEKPRIKCAVCPNRRFLPVTDDSVRRHLTGTDDAGAPFTLGVYPMLLDETCHLLAVDFDGKTSGDDASAYLSTCTRRSVPAALERSRSGNGGHVWLFFDTAVAAGLARRLGAALLTETMDDRPDLGFRSHDRFFPSQDTLPHGGFGNLIALPLQGTPRKTGNSVFVDADLNPFPDQWAYLSQLGRVQASQAESLVREAEKDGRVLGVRFHRARRVWRGPVVRARRFCSDACKALPETRDRFRVNERLPIPFSEAGHMEVDFLDPASKVVLELDGAQHLGDREAYRRDRRKDALLQEHGYLVLRFLAEDLGTRLDAVLDEVLRALARRTGGGMGGSGHARGTTH